MHHWLKLVELVIRSIFHKRQIQPFHHYQAVSFKVPLLLEQWDQALLAVLKPTTPKPSH
jgi:hypothetical protein